MASDDSSKSSTLNEPVGVGKHGESSAPSPIDHGSPPPTAAPAADAAVAEKGDVAAGAPDPNDEYGGRSKGKVAIIMAALCMAVFLAALDVTIITTALPTISEHFHSTSGYTWIGSAFTLANAASVPSWGKISDIFGRKPMLLLANIVFMIGSLVAALSTSIGMLIAARAVQGLGGGGLVILVNITIGDLFSLRVRGAFYGVIGGVWSLASAIGPIIGGVLTERASWRWCFYINLPLDGLAFFILLIFLDIKTPTTPILEGLKAIDWIGSLLVIGATLMFLFGLQFGGETYPWASATVICLIVFGVLTFVIFGFYEKHIPPYPLMPTRLFAQTTNIASLTVVFIHGLVFISGSYYLPLYFQSVRGATPIMSGVYVLPTAAALSVSSIGTGIYVRKAGLFIPPIYLGLSMMTLGFGLFINFDATSSWAKLIVFQLVAGFGIGPLFQAPIIALQAHINPRDIGTATATLGFCRQLATSISIVIGQVVFQNSMAKKSASLTAALGPQLAKQIGGGNAGANSAVINALPAAQAVIARAAVADSLQPMWIMYTCFSAAGLVAAFFIQKKVLSREHHEAEVGLEAEKQHAALDKSERDERKASRKVRKSGDLGRRSGDLSVGGGSRPSTAGGSGRAMEEGVPPLPEGGEARVKDLEKAGH
ncbi:hypothetical protein B0A48_14372 [Cryoendolithus antarcticus]|uniref:Efflux pump dotC n=1 Tax=Cryoendolithus antarcticus TaxID=1507870 RepID=A0A1V8SJS7_9PEZI|nr:hypothetical protein B0A48_14372 [Cryoendolithus antarcticus]